MAEKKVVLVTGASSGIGLATALKLLKEGHVVYGGARRVAAMAPIEAGGGHVLSLDVGDEASMTAAVETILEEEGRIDVLVNNAGYPVYGAVEDVPIADARRQFEVNLFGLARMTQLVLPGMRERRSGTIVNISSMGAVIYTPLGAWYHATKHAVEGFSDCLRLELAPFGIDVVIVAPGAIDTGFNGVLGEQVTKASGQGPYAGMAKAIAGTARPGRGSKPEVIADVIARAVAARRPKTRYRAGQFSHLLVYLRRALPDRWFDRLILSAAG
ncbi:MAG: SDR family NAD(P)-dependent oxidoreductase [Bauldia sp.]|nr:SDR family NAD(P)-dependent oxidoreductase [Bauldia sp.]